MLYRLEGRAIWTVFNEKVLAGLGRDLATTGRLSPGRRRGRPDRPAPLPRPARTAGAPQGPVIAAATAAVREAADGRAFVQRVASETGPEVRVLTGEEEARYAALGVIAGQPDAQGVVGDLGGSSLELMRLDGRGPDAGVTLPLGPFALGDRRARLRCRTCAGGGSAPWRRSPAPSPPDTLNAVGGAWRNLALLHMR